jgi:hypothetical protein
VKASVLGSPLVPLLAVPAVFGALLSSFAASASANEGRVGYTVKNDSPYLLILGAVTSRPSASRWDTPARTIRPGQSDSPAWRFDMNTWLGTYAYPEYDAYDLRGGRQTFIGEIDYGLDVSCTFTVDCQDWQARTWARLKNPTQSVGLAWSDNGTSPADGYHGTLVVGGPVQGGFWRDCVPLGAGRRIANLRVHVIGCHRAKAVIRRGHVNRHRHWHVRGWRCDSGRGHRRLHVRCKRYGMRIRFDRAV